MISHTEHQCMVSKVCVYGTSQTRQARRRCSPSRWIRQSSKNVVGNGAPIEEPDVNALTVPLHRVHAAALFIESWAKRGDGLVDDTASGVGQVVVVAGCGTGGTSEVPGGYQVAVYVRRVK